MIKTIKIKNFKSIKEQTLDDLPLIVGIWARMEKEKVAYCSRSYGRMKARTI